MSQPLPPLFGITTDIARQSVLDQVLSLLQEVNRKVDIIMSQDASIAATAARLETAATAEAAAISALQGLVVALRNEPAPLSQATLDALAAAEAHVTSATAAGTADVAADNPPPSGA